MPSSTKPMPSPADQRTAIQLHRATLSDVDAIAALVASAYAPWVPIMGREPRPMQADYAEAVTRHMIDLHYVRDLLAALIEMDVRPDHLLVVNVAVSPSFQGRGLGRALLAHAEDVARSHGLDEMRLYTNELMTANLRLYKALGYGIDREEAFMGGCVVHMSKRI